MVPLTRRSFMKSCMFLASGMTIAGFTGPSTSKVWGDGSEFEQTSCGMKKQSAKKVLVAYASMYGSTGKVAAAIAADLCTAGASVDVLLAGNVKDVSIYRAVIVGSAIKSEEWLPEAKEFVIRNRAILKEIPTAYFLTCLTLSKDSEGTRKKALSFLDPVLAAAPEVKPASIGLFAGVLDYSKYDTTVGAIMKYKMWTKGIKEGDYRDWRAIHTWADLLKRTTLAVKGETHAVN